MAQLSHPYITTGKTIALTRWNFIYIINIYVHTPMYVKVFKKEYNYILDKENKLV